MSRKKKFHGTKELSQTQKDKIKLLIRFIHNQIIYLDFNDTKYVDYIAGTIGDKLFKNGLISSGYASKHVLERNEKTVAEHFYPRMAVGKFILKHHKNLLFDKNTDLQFDSNIFQLIESAMTVHTITKREHSIVDKYQKKRPYDWEWCYEQAGIKLVYHGKCKKKSNLKLINEYYNFFQFE